MFIADTAREVFLHVEQLLLGRSLQLTFPLPIFLKWHCQCCRAFLNLQLLGCLKPQEHLACKGTRGQYRSHGLV